MGREKFKWRTYENESTDLSRRSGSPCSSNEVSVMEMERREWIIQLDLKINQEMRGIFERGEGKFPLRHSPRCPYIQL
jgi:hypothetical protein